MRTSIRRLRAAGASAAMLALALSACATGSGSTESERWTLAGQITYRERITLPPSAIAIVQLVDATGTRANVTPLAEDRIAPAGQVPIRFELTYDALAIDTAGQYALLARIEDGGGRILFETRTAIAVQPWSARTVEALLYAAAPPPGEQSAAEPIEYACEGMRFGVTYRGDRAATVTVAGDSMELRSIPSASGARYASERAEFWSKGDEATLTIGGRIYDCRLATAESDPWQRARATGVAIRAVGQEPGWTMELYEGDRIVLVTGYGADTSTYARPVRSRIAQVGERYTVRGERSIEVTVEGRRCADVMSGEPFALTVTVVAAADTLRGCGRRLSGGGGTR